MHNIEKLKKILSRKKIEQVKTPYPYLGQSIKKRRLELNLTQTEVCKGICSVSYLSKIENMRGDLGYLFIDKILERLDMGSNIYMLQNQRVLFYGILRAFINDDKKVINSIIKKITKEEGTYIYNVGQYIKKIQEGKNEQATLIFDYLVSLKGYLGYEEIYIIIALEYMNCVYNNRIEDAVELNSLLDDNSRYSDNIIETFIAKVRFNYYLKIEDFERCRKCLDILCEYYTTNGKYQVYSKELFRHTYKRFECGLEYNTNLKLTKEQNLFLMIMKAIMSEDYEIIKKFDKIPSTADVDFAKALACDHFNVNYSSYINNYDYKDEKKIIIKSLEQKMKGLNEYKSYLKHVAIPYAVANGDKRLIRYFSNKLATELINKARYKDAVKIMKNI